MKGRAGNTRRRRETGDEFKKRRIKSAHIRRAVKEKGKIVVCGRGKRSVYGYTYTVEIRNLCQPRP